MDGSVISILEASLSAAALRQKVIANNIANAETPGFKGSRVSFETELRAWLTGEGKSGLRTTHPLHMGNANDFPRPGIIKSHLAMRPDGNSVDIDSEQVLLADNVLRFQALAMQVDEQLARMRFVVTEGRG